MTPSSKRAASDALWGLVEILGKGALLGGEVVLKTYAKTSLAASMSRSSYNQKLKRFQKYGLIKKELRPIGPIFVITKTAKRLRKKATSKKPRQDGFSSVIIFDIPQDKRNARDTFRRFLIRNGFSLLRESCFISPYIISDDIKELAKELKLEKNISFFAAKPEYLI